MRGREGGGGQTKTAESKMRMRRTEDNRQSSKYKIKLLYKKVEKGRRGEGGHGIVDELSVAENESPRTKPYSAIGAPPRLEIGEGGRGGL